MFTSDVLIIGSGIAGLFAALKLADKAQVAVLTKKEAFEANTQYAQGGIASVLAKDDSFESHIEDTLRTGAGLAKREVVEFVISRGPAMIEELCRLGVRFSATAESGFSLGLEGGHSKRRVLHAGDLTGREIERALLAAIRAHPNIRVYEHRAAIDLIRHGDACVGAYALDTLSNTVDTHLAKVTILATGGAGKVYLYTSNPDIATGDGMAMAKRAGSALVNMEFVQFHPTCLYHPKAKSFLISEAIRGEGAILKTVEGQRFMQEVHPLKELAPRDVVARAIDTELKRSGQPYVLLDISKEDPTFVRTRFPHLCETCAKFGYDLTREAIPVVPAAHYFCGGVPVKRTGETAIPRLYAIGEVSHTGLHGANRLASNSLLEAVVYADAAANAIKSALPDYSPVPAGIPDWDPGHATDSDEQVVIAQNWDEVRRLMWNYVGIVRSTKRLTRAKRRIDLFKDEVLEYYWNFKITKDLIELRNLLCVADAVIESALKRKESRGLHHTLDYPNPLDEARDTEV